MKIVIINGYAGSGKDTFVDLVKGSLPSGYLVENISSVGEIRDIAFGYFGWDGVSKDMKTRQLLSDLKNLQTAYCDGPFNYMVDMIMSFKNRAKLAAIFLHVREVDEIKKLKDRFPDAITVVIVRPDHDQCCDVVNDIYTFRYDENIYNDGTLLDFKMKAKRFIFDHELDLL